VHAVVIVRKDNWRAGDDARHKQKGRPSEFRRAAKQ
jgi:hypothetical protein